MIKLFNTYFTYSLSAPNDSLCSVHGEQCYIGFMTKGPIAIHQIITFLHVSTLLSNYQKQQQMSNMIISCYILPQVNYILSQLLPVNYISMHKFCSEDSIVALMN